MMKNLEISPKFTIEDIHKIREYHYEVTKDMPLDERVAFYEEGAQEFLKYLEGLKQDNLVKS